MELDVVNYLQAIDHKLDRLIDDVKDYREHQQIILYGAAGNNGIVGDIIELKQSRRTYNRVLAGIISALTLILGEGVRRWLR